jgi:hypothetical protein
MVLELILNTTGFNNTASGFDALNSNTTGSNNIALGASAGDNLTTGSNNIDIGNAGIAGESGKSASAREAFTPIQLSPVSAGQLWQEV